MGRAKQEQLEYLDRTNHYLKDDEECGWEVSWIVDRLEELQKEFRERSVVLSKLYLNLDVEESREVARELTAILSGICTCNRWLGEIEHQHYKRHGESPPSV